MIGLVGYTGMIGQTLLQKIQFDRLYNSNNIDQVINEHLNLLIVTAPTSNRRHVNNNAETDKININCLLDNLKKSCAKQIILISTLDAIALPNTPYGANRKFFAEEILNYNHHHKVIYIGAPIGPLLNKGLLYDLKYKQFLDSIDANSEQQYTPLDYLWDYIESIVATGVQSHFFFSEPIRTDKIIDKFCPTLPKKYTASAVKYNISNYQFTSAFIFEQMQKYFRIVV